MCRPKDNIDKKTYRLSDYFNQHWDNYIKSPKHFISREQYKAVAAIRACRTESLGIDHYVCEDCGEISKVYHSCKNRFCPTCSWKDTMDWAKKIENEMFNLPHRHVVFTLPHSLNNLLNDNKQQMLDMLFKAASESVQDWMMHKYKLKPGIISVLHTFGETKELHPHIHMIVSWGGINQNYYPEEIKGEYIKYDFIQTKFRCKFEDKLVELFDAGGLYHNFSDRISFMQFLKRANKKQWRIHFEPKMDVPEEVIRYIGRYSKRACISEHKITNIEGDYITFCYKDNKNLDYKGKPIVKELTLHFNDFFPRLLQHVPLPYTRLVRYSGAYAARTRALIRQRYPAYKAKTEQKADNNESCQMLENSKFCQTCNRPKQYLYTTFKGRNNKIIYMTRFNPKRKEDKPNEQAA